MSIIAVNKIAKKLLAKYWSIYVGLGSSFLDNLQRFNHAEKSIKMMLIKQKQWMKKAEHFRKITMKVLTMQLNSVSLMDLLAYGGAAIGILTALLQFQADQLTVLGAFYLFCFLLNSLFHFVYWVLSSMWP